MHALSVRKRYSRGSTLRKGYTFPFTSAVSAHSSVAQIGWWGVAADVLNAGGGVVGVS